jgi:hypothetical protein
MPQYCDRCNAEIYGPDMLSSLSRRKVIDLLEKAVMDGRIKDTRLFDFEGRGGMELSDFTVEEKEIMTEYLTEKSTKHMHKSDQKVRRFLRPVG